MPADFIGVARPAHPHAGSHDALLSHLLAQGEALANGHSSPDAQKAYPEYFSDLPPLPAGNR